MFTKRAAPNAMLVDTASVSYNCCVSIYTKQGDKGETGLYSKNKRTRISKASLIINAIGCIDEVNSYLGLINSSTNNKELKKETTQIQKDLFVLSSVLAGSKLRFSITKTKRIEKKIDEIEKELPKLKHFIFPGGEKAGAMLHYVRALVRKAERKVVELAEEETVKPAILIYLNRLSDYIFVLARKVNLDQKAPEEIWEGK